MKYVLFWNAHCTISSQSSFYLKQYHQDVNEINFTTIMSTNDPHTVRNVATYILYNALHKRAKYMKGICV